MPSEYANPQLRVSPPELWKELADASKRPLVIDLRPAEQFATGHIPHAVHLDLFGLSLTDTDPAPMKAFLWIIEHLLASRGVTADRPVVLYESTSGMLAARAFWFLEHFGHTNVRVLNGGTTAWVAAGLPLTTATEAPVASTWTGVRRSEVVATWRDLNDKLGNPDVAVLDTRSDGEYCGTTVRSARGGTVPGAIHIEWTRNIAGDGTFKSADELRAMYEAAGVTPDREVIAYCQGGYRAANAYLALRLLGYPRLSNYLGSWREWGDRLDLPIEHPTAP
jgi:thiosulfate/3-mercaptopyruvate sulfurtransferase